MMISINDLYEIMINQHNKKAILEICNLIKRAHVTLYINKDIKLAYVSNLCYFDYARSSSSSIIKMPEKESNGASGHCLSWAINKEAQEDDVVSYVTHSINNIQRVSDRTIFIEYYLLEKTISNICYRYNVSTNKFYSSINRAINELIDICGIKKEGEGKEKCIY